MNLRPALIALATGAALLIAACAPKHAEEDAASSDAESVTAPAIPDGDPTTAADAQAAQEAAMAASPTANETPIVDPAGTPSSAAAASASTSASAHAGH